MGQRLQLVTTIGSVAGACLLFGQSFILGQGREFSNRDLKGEYAANTLELRLGGPMGTTQIACEFTGILTFDGAGNAAGSGTERCAPLTFLHGETATIRLVTGNLLYGVSGDGTVLLREGSEDPNPVHGRLADRGRILLLDGTTRTSDDRFFFHGTAVAL